MSTILVVDDMAVFREPIAASLRQRGYQTLCAADGRQALTAARGQRPDLILLDMAMPVMDGLAFLKARAADPHVREIPVILLTAVTEREYVINAAKLGVRDYLLKSAFSLDELIARVQMRLGDPAENDDIGELVGEVEPNPAQASQGGAGQASGAANAPAPKAAVGGSQTAAAATAAVAAAAVVAAAPSPAARTAAPSPAPAGKIVTLPAGATIRDVKPILARNDVQDALDQCGELKGLSPTVAQIMQMTRHANCSIERVAKVVKQDHGVALKILKLANSAAYTRGEPISSVEKAVLRIGLSQIRQMMLNIGVIERFSRSEEDHPIGIPQFWEHSIACALIAAELARARKAPENEIDAAFTMGLLHDVGRLVYLEMYDQKYRTVLATAEQLQLPLEQVESRMMLINHADAMDRVLHTWAFPKELIHPIALHHLSVGNIRRMAPRTLNEVATLALANRLAHAMLLGTSGNLTIYPTEEFASTLKLDGELFGQIQELIPDETTNIKFAMLSHSNQQSWKRLRDELRGKLDQPMRPVFVSAEPAYDALGLFCRALGKWVGEEEPNVGVIHLKHARERVAVTTTYREAEAAAGVEALPLIILSPNGDLTLENRTMAGRRVQLLPFPVTIARFIGALNALPSMRQDEAAA